MRRFWFWSIVPVKSRELQETPKVVDAEILRYGRMELLEHDGGPPLNANAGVSEFKARGVEVQLGSNAGVSGCRAAPKGSRLAERWMQSGAKLKLRQTCRINGFTRKTEKWRVVRMSDSVSAEYRLVNEETNGALTRNVEELYRRLTRGSVDGKSSTTSPLKSRHVSRWPASRLR
jgi:hypothetical protein